MQTLGSAALTAFIVQALTGAILAMYYKPSSEIDPLTGQPIAYTSIQAITDEITLGWLVRGMHRWGASVFIILLFLHMGRVFLFGAYKYPRELQWITGVLILVMGMLMGFTGYLLPWTRPRTGRPSSGSTSTARRPSPALARAVPRERAGDRVGHASEVVRAAHAPDPGRADRADRHSHLPRHAARCLVAAVVEGSRRP